MRPAEGPPARKGEPDDTDRPSTCTRLAPPAGSVSPVGGRRRRDRRRRRRRPRRRAGACRRPARVREFDAGAVFHDAAGLDRPREDRRRDLLLGRRGVRRGGDREARPAQVPRRRRNSRARGQRGRGRGRERRSRRRAGSRRARAPHRPPGHRADRDAAADPRSPRNDDVTPAARPRSHGGSRTRADADDGAGRRLRRREGARRRHRRGGERHALVDDRAARGTDPRDGTGRQASLRRVPGGRADGGCGDRAEGDRRGRRPRRGEPREQPEEHLRRRDEERAGVVAGAGPEARRLRVPVQQPSLRTDHQPAGEHAPRPRVEGEGARAPARPHLLQRELGATRTHGTTRTRSGRTTSIRSGACPARERIRRDDRDRLPGDRDREDESDALDDEVRGRASRARREAWAHRRRVGDDRRTSRTRPPSRCRSTRRCTARSTRS